METAALDANGAIAKIVEQGALFAFMLLCIIVLVFVVKAMYNRIMQQTDQQTKILLDSTLAINNNTAALGALTKQVERLADVR